MILCGWCDASTPVERCTTCGRDPALPWIQRGLDVPEAVEDRPAGRPPLDVSQVRQKVRLALKELGPDATNEQLAESLDVSVSTVRRWRKESGL